ncbi:hypothetical protein K8Q94_02660 [Candidatus Nomurabacteria bacterium]|nr:hypothetical protein [Candidatus Nomurabacteria bacterium]
MLLVVASIAILALIVLRAVNPIKHFADIRNTGRYTDVNTILNAIYQYEIDNNGMTPDTRENGGESIPMGIYNPNINIELQDPLEICRTGAESCAGLVDLSNLTFHKKYLIAMPVDLLYNLGDNVKGPNGTGYYIVRDAQNSNRITVIAGRTEIFPTTFLTSLINMSL